MELQRERRYNKKSMKRKKVIPMQQTLPPAAAEGGSGRRGPAKMCGCSGQVCPAGRAAAESRERPWETAACLHNIVNCTAFMLKSLLAMWKNGFHNADFGRETRQPARRYPYWSRKSEQQNGNCI